MTSFIDDGDVPQWDNRSRSQSIEQEGEQNHGNGGEERNDEDEEEEIRAPTGRTSRRPIIISDDEEEDDGAEGNSQHAAEDGAVAPPFNVAVAGSSSLNPALPAQSHKSQTKNSRTAKLFSYISTRIFSPVWSKMWRTMKRVSLPVQEFI